MESQPLPGMSVPPVSAEQLRAFAVAARDPNPIHQDEATARANGLPGVIAHGMLVASYLGEYAQHLRLTAFGGEYALRRFQVRFKGMTQLGESLQLKATWKMLSPEQIQLQLEALGGQGEVKATASASLWKS